MTNRKFPRPIALSCLLSVLSSQPAGKQSITESAPETSKRSKSRKQTVNMARKMISPPFPDNALGHQSKLLVDSGRRHLEELKNS
ncbi:hypothetical protein COLO4_34073 [Corchorus olitorius]|uniref:Uncharacterized protein n=1 Tax=Corchorus olitorius TaxID=93759 RepID=A0A1R3GNW2_9ROSI|nr:hypothetical protein COLO4_34073 [Corchorus olitorius]